MMRHTLYPIVGFAGGMGVGKSTAAHHLLHAYPYEPASFAEPIKDMLIALGLEREQLYDQRRKAEPCQQLGGMPPRVGLQTLGTEWGRDTIWEDVWCNAMRKRLVPRIRDGKRYVIDDVRFDNEAQLIRALGGIVIKIERKLPDPRSWWRKLLNLQHPTERGVAPHLIDHVIQNNGYTSEMLQDIEVAMRAPWLPEIK